MQNGEHNLNGRNALGWVNGNWDASAIVLNADPAGLGDGDLDGIAVTSECFVYGVVYDLIDQVVKAARARRTDVHAGTFSNGFKPFENLDIAGLVTAVFWCRHI